MPRTSEYVAPITKSAPFRSPVGLQQQMPKSGCEFLCAAPYSLFGDTKFRKRCTDRAEYRRSLARRGDDEEVLRATCAVLQDGGGRIRRAAGVDLDRVHRNAGT